MTPEIVRISLPTPFPVGPVNAFLIKAEEPVLVDAGQNTDDAYARLVDKIAEHGLALADIAHIVLTHGHLDHAGMAGRIQAESGARLYAHPLVARQYGHYDDDVAEHTRFLRAVMARCGVPAETIENVIGLRQVVHRFGVPATIDHVLRDGEEVAGLRVHFRPGHSASDTVLYHAPTRAAFTGDHVLKGMSPNPLIRQQNLNEPRPLLLREYIASLEATRAMDLAACYPGHGSPFADYRGIIDNILERHAQRIELVYGAFDDGALTPYDAAMRLLPSLSAAMLQFGLSMVVANCDVLVEEGRLREEEQDGVMFYAQRAKEAAARR